MSERLTSLSTAPVWLWLGFLGLVIVLLFIDLGLFKYFRLRRSTSATRLALLESAAWMSVALLFNVGVAFHFGHEFGVQFLTAYLIEKSLSIDNLFIMFLVFNAFKIPAKYQHRVLFFGVLGAIVMRGLFILIGAELLHRFHWVFYIFGTVLILTAYRFVAHSAPQQLVEVRDNWVVRFVQRTLRVAKSRELTNDYFFTIEDGRRVATGLFLALVVIEITDLIFAVDSIPAVFSVTSDAFLAFSSNIFALLGLRALYFVLAESVSRFRYLKPGLATVLFFIGLKMIVADWIPISSGISLAVVASVLFVAGLSSVLVDKRDLKSVRQNDPHN